MKRKVSKNQSRNDTDDLISRPEYENSYYNWIPFVQETRGKIEHVRQM